MCTAIAKIAHSAAQGRTVQLVRVDVGYLRQIVPDTLQHCWEMVVFNTPLDGVPLEVREVEAIIECDICAARTVITDPIFQCGTCESRQTHVVTGNELCVTSLDLCADED